MSVATNDLSDSTDVVQQVCGIRWKIEFHRELKQLTGVGLVSAVKLAFREITLVVPCWSESAQGDCLPSLPDYLPDQAWAIKLLNSAPQNPSIMMTLA